MIIVLTLVPAENLSILMSEHVFGDFFAYMGHPEHHPISVKPCVSAFCFHLIVNGLSFYQSVCSIMISS
jgi:hypothetical protein